MGGRGPRVSELVQSAFSFSGAASSVSLPASLPGGASASQPRQPPLPLPGPGGWRGGPATLPQGRPGRQRVRRRPAPRRRRRVSGEGRCRAEEAGAHRGPHPEQAEQGGRPGGRGRRGWRAVVVAVPELDGPSRSGPSPDGGCPAEGTPQNYGPWRRQEASAAPGGGGRPRRRPLLPGGRPPAPRTRQQRPAQACGEESSVQYSNKNTSFFSHQKIISNWQKFSEEAPPHGSFPTKQQYTCA